MAVRIGSNISSLQAQRRLSEASSALSKTYERLSSGQRINRASDDAAGLAIADALRVGSRISTQGIRNLNDAVSYYSITEGAAKELKNIILRAKELSEQSANGVYSDKQRAALDSELQSVGQEYNRILQSTSFNGRNVFDREGGTLVSQAGDSILMTSLSSARATELDTISRLTSGVDGSPADADSTLYRYGVSADGRYVVFSSSANLIEGVSGTQSYRKDLQTGELLLISCSTDGTAGAGSSTTAAISRDGRYVVFTSDSANLIEGVSGSQIYRKDLQTGMIELASASSNCDAADGDSIGPAVSSDGRYVFFSSKASNLVAGVGDGVIRQLYRKDMESGEIRLVSSAANGTAGDLDSLGESISADARYAAFMSRSSTLINGVGGAAAYQLFWKDLETNEILLASSSASGEAGTNGGGGVFMSSDALCILYFHFTESSP